MPSPRKVRDLRRTVSKKPPKKKFIIFCEGRNTEPEYFRSLRRICQNALIDIEPIGGVGTPATIAARAIDDARERGLARNSRKRLNSFEASDEVWAVFDRDQHPYFIESIQQCEAHGVHVARSNPCFELWIILHLNNFDSPDDRHAVQRALRQMRPEYDPSQGKIVDFDEIVKGVEDAERRADEQLKRRIAEGGQHNPPSTTVHYLTVRIRKAGGIGDPAPIPVQPEL